MQLGVLQCLASSFRVARCFPPCRGLSFDSTLSLRRFPFSSPFLRLFFAFSSPHLRLAITTPHSRHLFISLVRHNPIPPKADAGVTLRERAAHPALKLPCASPRVAPRFAPKHPPPRRASRPPAWRLMCAVSRRRLTRQKKYFPRPSKKSIILCTFAVSMCCIHDEDLFR